ncbi:putative hc-toxin synthetase protein [Botrytis fragariae]|uniref:Putative hc-toxin synthetase protein n=1 Tax=Botrytis fragariae TaxID=1964551 RepID=A0A8H6EFN1_9HELO|nr:putative hc-toxin synthetase protein [Botrytis fragariae]KAF5870150.1 putative hc-toxin synthetase protein [Botrytis fragariae]
MTRSYHADGSLIFVGRKDTQVKLHGQRIELGEVESCKEWGKEFENSELTRLRDYLSTCLPTAMIPKHYISVDSIPVLSSGKMDRRSLRQLSPTLNSQQLGVSLDETSEKLPPTSTKEYKLRKIWAALLDTGEESIGVNDNFFHLGGDSISAIKMVAAARKNNLQLTVAQIFDYPLLADLALTTTTESISEAPQKSREATDLAELVSREWDIDLNSIEDIYTATPLQKGLIALTTRNHKTNTLQQVFRLSADVDIDRFIAAWENVVSQNAILRTRIIFTRSSILQVVLRENIDWQTAVSLQEYLNRDNGIAFDYGTRLVRLGLVPDRDGAHYFIWTNHHSTCDGWSHFGMLDMFGGCYERVETTRSPPFKNFVAYFEENKDGN